MGVRKAAWKVIKPFANIPTWMGWDLLKHQTNSVLALFKNLFKVKKTYRVETFEQAKERLQLTEEHIDNKRQHCFYFSLLYAFIAIAFLVYSAYLYEYYNLYNAVVSFLLSILALVFAFRENFWWFQMTQRKLGCRFSEWFNYIILGRDNEY